MTTGAWRCLRQGDGEIIATVDFLPGRFEAGFAELATLLGGTETVLEAVVPAVEPADETDLVAGWLVGCGDGIGTVKAVLGYCAGASLACALADRVAGRGVVPAVVLFDPQPVTKWTLYGQFVRVVEAVESFGRAGCLQDEILRARELVERSEGPGSDLTNRLADRYRTLVGSALAELDVEAGYVDELHQRFLGYLGYLELARRTPLRSSECEPFVILSATHENVPDGWPSQRFEVARSELLRNEAVARAVGDVIGRVCSCRPAPTGRRSPGSRR